MKMMNNNTNTRAFAEQLGNALSFGTCIITCDALLNPQSYGYFYPAYDSDPIVCSPTDPKGTFEYWLDFLQQAQKWAAQNDQDPDTWGVRMAYNHGRGSIGLDLVRVSYMRDRALDMAENDKWACPSTIYKFGRNEDTVSVYLEKEGRSPYPLDDDGRAEVEAGANREDVEDAAMLFQDLGFKSEKGTDPTEKEGMDEMDDWQ